MLKKYMLRLLNYDESFETDVPHFFQLLARKATNCQEFAVETPTMAQFLSGGEAKGSTSLKDEAERGPTNSNGNRREGAADGEAEKGTKEGDKCKLVCSFPLD